LLKSLPPTSSNLKQISDEMEATFHYRQHKIKTTHKDPSSLLAEYPRMVDCNKKRLVLVFVTFERLSIC
jgi:hypothetical protein